MMDFRLINEYDGMKNGKASTKSGIKKILGEKSRQFQW